MSTREMESPNPVTGSCVGLGGYYYNIDNNNNYCCSSSGGYPTRDKLCGTDPVTHNLGCSFPVKNPLCNTKCGNTKSNNTNNTKQIRTFIGVL